MTQTANLTATVILDGLKLTLRYADMLLKDVPVEKFSHSPHETMNHPCFCIGHLALYPNKVLKLIGRDDQVEERPEFDKLFSASATCRNDPAAYPPMDEVVAYFRERHAAVENALADVRESALQQPYPGEGRAAEMFQTVGSAVNFYLNCHTMLHLGQISAWRRAVGMPSAM